MNPELAEALNRRIELYEAWAGRPANYPPPKWADPEAVHEHRRRWLSSTEYAHAQQILRAAGWREDSEPEPSTTN